MSPWVIHSIEGAEGLELQVCLDTRLTELRSVRSAIQENLHRFQRVPFVKLVAVVLSVSKSRTHKVP